MQDFPLSMGLPGKGLLKSFQSDRDSALLRHPLLGTGRDGFPSSGSGRYQALDSSRAGNLPRLIGFSMVPPKRVSSSLRIFAPCFLFAK